jgi:hypothetical protein
MAEKYFKHFGKGSLGDAGASDVDRGYFDADRKEDMRGMDSDQAPEMDDFKPFGGFVGRSGGWER